MQRILVSLIPAQIKWLKSESSRRGISVTELIRRLIDKARGDL